MIETFITIYMGLYIIRAVFLSADVWYISKQSTLKNGDDRFSSIFIVFFITYSAIMILAFITLLIDLFVEKFKFFRAKTKEELDFVINSHHNSL